MKINWNLFYALFFATLTENFVKVYGDDSLVKKYIGGTVTRKEAVNGKPNEYKILKFLATGSGTAIYKTDYNGVEAAIKVMMFSKHSKLFESMMRNEKMIFDKLKVESKTAVELGRIEMYDYIEEGYAFTKEENDKKVGGSVNAGKTTKAATKDSKEEVKVMAIVVTYFKIDLYDYISSIANNYDSMRKMIKKVLKALWNLHDKGILHNDVSLLNIGIMGDDDDVVMFDFGISVVYNELAKAEDMAYYLKEIPLGIKPVLSWNAALSGYECNKNQFGYECVIHEEYLFNPKYIRKYVDDIVSAILSFYSGYGNLPWFTDEIELQWQKKNKVSLAKENTCIERCAYEYEGYTNLREHYGSRILTSIDNLLQTLYKKVTSSNSTKINYQDLLNEVDKDGSPKLK